ncbi:serine/threonine-protein kinase 11-interacting protein isoform X1 [Microcaecilia unicolor]|uniref:Serine/threonine-protein kinase 11-interacting protein n=2 Tax=Microcaecilia unicolor TaxID=1415580 RepID=A0A6P7YFD5_9AMPH|nr:serine/threonine-protein kinase 11-interacting protein-like isoform X1 [Microcaecilia unicolor]XP_030066152.1 serine/threonine-protein kinase 11-interacting protein-like isoform X1 [Microcaecilia unicolor]
MMATLVHSLTQLLQDCGDAVLDGSRTLTLFTPTLQHLTRLFEQHLLLRKQVHGFQALPSHPADSTAILQTQFLFDMLQKTLSVKLVHPLSCGLQTPVNIFPFKSLRRLELRCIPLHCLQGLRSIYSQLEILICSKCIITLEEMISLCAGDLSSALPWLELHTLNFSYNRISALDHSLQLLNVLKVLDLSHNSLQQCAEYLMALTELEYLNLAYNYLSSVPVLSLRSQTLLVTLVLRNNELENIDGVEQLVNLQHVDLSYNLLLKHAVLAPLSSLHKMKTVHLEGNPLFFQRDHRIATVHHLSPKAASPCLILDGEPLSTSELMRLQKEGPVTSQALRSSAAEGSGTDHTGLESSCAGDLSDSYSAGDSGPTQLPRKKSKVRVRRASISEPSDVEQDYRTNTSDVILQHQDVIERINSFRDLFGVEWLQYRRQLEGEIVMVPEPETSTSINYFAPDLHSTVSVVAPCKSTLQEPQEISTSVNDPLANLAKDEEKKPNAEAPHWDLAKREKEQTNYEKGEEWKKENLEADLCPPVLVCPVQGEWSECLQNPWIFLRLNSRHMIEVDLQDGHDLQTQDLQSLLKIDTSEVSWKWKNEDKLLPLLELQFDYICRDRQQLRYVVLDDSPEISIKSLLQILYPVLEKNLERMERQNKEPVKLQCLKCKTEFSDLQRPGMKNFYIGEKSWNNSEPAGKDHVVGVHTFSSICPSCASDHVVLLPPEIKPEEQRSSTPVPSAESLQNLRSISLPELEASGSPSSQDLLSRRAGTILADLGGETSEFDGPGTVCTKEKSKLCLEGKEEALLDSSNSFAGHENTGPSSSSSADLYCTRSHGENSPHSSSLSRTDTSGGSLMGSYQYGSPPQRSAMPLPTQEQEPEEIWQLSLPMNFMLRMEDFRQVDHRLKLFLDMEVFKENMEEFQCYMKVPVVKYGRDSEFLAIVVVSSRNMYILEVTSEIRGQPSNWLKVDEVHHLSNLRYLGLGLWSQSLHIQFEKPGASYKLLIRNKNRCDKFYQCIMDTMDESPPHFRSTFCVLPKQRMNSQHCLWSLLLTELSDSALRKRQRPPFFYMLAYILQDDIRSPVSLLVTPATLYLLEESHQWEFTPAPDQASESEDFSGGGVTVKQKQPIGCISSVHVFQVMSCCVQLRIYDETRHCESQWHLQTECSDVVRDLLEFLRGPWEALYRIKFNIVMHTVID